MFDDSIKHQIFEAFGYDVDQIANDPWNIRWAIEQEQAGGVQFGAFHRQFMLDRAPHRVQRILASMREQRHLDSLVAVGQGFAALEQPSPLANVRAAIASTTTETNLWNPGKFCTLPVGSIKAGRRWRIQFGGIVQTTATPTVVATARCGTNNAAPPTGVTHGASTTVTTGTIPASSAWMGQWQASCRTLDLEAATSTTQGVGVIWLPAAVAATVTPHICFGGTVATTVDPTAAQGWSVSWTWSASSASNTVTTQDLGFESLDN